MRTALILLVLLLAHCGECEELEVSNRRLRQQLKALDAVRNSLDQQTNALTRAIQVARISAELMEGIRDSPPLAGRTQRLVYEDHVNEPYRFSGERMSAPDRHVWIALKPGMHYRWVCEVEASGLSGVRDVKFGGMVKVSKTTHVTWPAANSGVLIRSGWQQLSFEFDLPQCGLFMLMYGPNGQTGSCAFRNIRGYVVEEE